jgi:HD-like signal output (HDOD) protein
MATATDLKLEQLPVLPAVVVRLMGLAPTSEGYFEEVLSISSEDPGLAVRVIHAANSALSAPRQPIESLQGAIARLGATHIGNLVATLAVTKVFEPKTRGEADLWVHSPPSCATTTAPSSSRPPCPRRTASSPWSRWPTG